MGVIDHISGASYLTLFTVNEFGELSAGNAVNMGVPNANGVAIMSPADDANEDRISRNEKISS